MGAQHDVFDVLAQQWDLRAEAQRLTQDVNEARFLVHQVVARALKKGVRDVGPLREHLAALARGDSAAR